MSKRQPQRGSTVRLQFLGANWTVTGSRYLLETERTKVLVDCGLFQGYKMLRLRNWTPFPVDPASIDAVVLTHAHLDHSGYLPRLVKAGFRGTVWCTNASRSLCGILLPDSGRLLEEEAAYANQIGSSRHHPAKPLYDEADARHSLEFFHGMPFATPFEAAPGIRTRFCLQGHILGAAAVSLEIGTRRITFSGDIGRPDDAVMYPPLPPMESDWIVTESTYGNRRHSPESLEQELQQALNRVLARDGVALIPAFAIGRAQQLLHLITRLQHAARLPAVPVYLNSPMAARVLDVYRHYQELHRLNDKDLDALRDAVHVVDSIEESKALNRRHGPMIIVAASGMLTGGRVLHHVLQFAPDPRNAIILTGYQAGGTRGAKLLEGARQLRIFGQDVSVQAEVICLQSASAHADADEILTWLGSTPRPPRKVFVTHGSADAAEALRQRIDHELGWCAHVPDYLEQADLET